MEYRTTDKHFEYFKERCEFWLYYLGLKSWRVYYKHAPGGEFLATCSTNYAGRFATIRLYKLWNIEPTDKALNESALHECLEILLSPLWGQAAGRAWDRDEYEKDHHAVIRVLEKVINK